MIVPFMYGIILGLLGIVIGVIVIPWAGVLVLKYWDWCSRKQKEMGL